MKMYRKYLLEIILIAEIVGSAATAQAMYSGKPSLEANMSVIAANNPDANIGYSPPDQSEEPAEVQAHKQRIPSWLITAVIFTVCILIMGAALNKHKCCCGRKKFP